MEIETFETRKEEWLERIQRKSNRYDKVVDIISVSSLVVIFALLMIFVIAWQ